MKRVWFCRVEVNGKQKNGLYYSEVGELLEGTYVEIADGETGDKEIARISYCLNYNNECIAGVNDYKGTVIRIASKSEYEKIYGVDDEKRDESVETLEAAAESGEEPAGF